MFVFDGDGLPLICVIIILNIMIGVGVIAINNTDFNNVDLIISSGNGWAVVGLIHLLVIIIVGLIFIIAYFKEKEVDIN